MASTLSLRKYGTFPCFPKIPVSHQNPLPNLPFGLPQSSHGSPTSSVTPARRRTAAFFFHGKLFFYPAAATRAERETRVPGRPAIAQARGDLTDPDAAGTRGALCSPLSARAHSRALPLPPPPHRLLPTSKPSQAHRSPATHPTTPRARRPRLIRPLLVLRPPHPECNRQSRPQRRSKARDISLPRRGEGGFAAGPGKLDEKGGTGGCGGGGCGRRTGTRSRCSKLTSNTPTPCKPFSSPLVVLVFPIPRAPAGPLSVAHQFTRTACPPLLGVRFLGGVRGLGCGRRGTPPRAAAKVTQCVRGLEGCDGLVDRASRLPPVCPMGFVVAGMAGLFHAL